MNVIFVTMSHNVSMPRCVFGFFGPTARVNGGASLSDYVVVTSLLVYVELVKRRWPGEVTYLESSFMTY